MRHERQLLDVTDISCWISDTLAENRAGLVIDQLFQRIRMIGLPKPNVYSVAWQQMSEEAVRCSIELGNRNDICAKFSYI